MTLYKQRVSSRKPWIPAPHKGRLSQSAPSVWVPDSLRLHQPTRPMATCRRSNSFHWLTEALLSFMHKLERQSGSGLSRGQPGRNGGGAYQVNVDPTRLVLTLLTDMRPHRRTNPVSHITNAGASWEGAAMRIGGWSAVAAIIGKTRGLLGWHRSLSESLLLAFEALR